MPDTKAQQHEAFIDRLGLRHFSGKEFTPYWTQVRNGVKNSIPNESLWLNIIPTIIIVDAMREQVGSSITLLSTYRSPAYNHAVGGEAASFHMAYKAIDFHCATDNPADWAAILKSWRGKKFSLPDNGGQFEFRGGIGIYPNQNFVHVDTRGYDANWTG